jgi:hypothetical protein
MNPGSIKDREFLDQLSEYEFLKNDSVFFGHRELVSTEEVI